MCPPNSLAGVMVGCPIEVYWPMDKVFYKGVVARSLPNALHVILYDDGVQETLDLRKERYRLLPSKTPAPRPAKEKLPVASPSPTKKPSLKMDLVTYTPPALPPRKRFRARLLRSKRSPKQAASSSPKVLLRQRIRPSRPVAFRRKKLSRMGDLISELSDYPSSSPKFVVPHRTATLPRYIPSS